ncbi:hypothetical protein VM98_38430, partial [Streptomyces rubellomurinus subsp. indigoferus]
LVVPPYQAVSGSGVAGVADLRDQAAKVVDGPAGLAHDGGPGEFPDPKVYRRPTPFNGVPRPGPAGRGEPPQLLDRAYTTGKPGALHQDLADHAADLAGGPDNA